jgi:hypothetical protein
MRFLLIRNVRLPCQRQWAQMPSFCRAGNHAEDDMADSTRLLARLEPYYRQRRLIGVAGIGIGDL